MRLWRVVGVFWAALLVGPMAGAQTGGPTGEQLQEQVEQLREQLRAQQEEIARLRRDLADREVERQHLRNAVGELQRLREQIAAGQAEEAERQAQRADQLQDLGHAMARLREADAILATGSKDVGDALDEAAGLLTGQAQVHVERAEAALAQDDLSSARLNIQAAQALVVANLVTGTDQPIAAP